MRLAVLTLFLTQTACSTVVHSQYSTSINPEKITGVTLKSGHTVAFNPAGAFVQGSALYGNGPNGQVIVPIDSIADVWTKQFSTSKTIGVALAVVAVVGVFFVVASKTSGSASGPGY